MGLAGNQVSGIKISQRIRMGSLIIARNQEMINYDACQCQCFILS